MRADCPKCQSKAAWISKTETDLLLKCMCGYTRVLFTTLVDTLDGDLGDDDDPGVKLPKQGTNLHKTLVVLSILPEGTSKEITDRLNELNGYLRAPGMLLRRDLLLTVSDVSSYLTILKSKSLVDRSEVRRGVSGGSSWVLTETAIELLEMDME